MNLDRRTFLKTGVGLAAAGTAWVPRRASELFDRPNPANDSIDDLRWMETSLHVRFAGRPRSLAAVRQGLWPIAPLRVLILRPHPLAGPDNRWEPRHSQSPRHLREELQRRANENEWLARANQNWAQIPDHKLGLINRITSAFASYYAVPEMAKEWAFGMAAREGLGATYTGSNVAVPDYFQKDLPGGGILQTDNHDIDHWLILIPDGTRDWEGWGDCPPVHVISTHIFARREQTNSWTCPVCVLSGRAVFSLVEEEPWHHWALESSPRVIELSRMNRASAARLLSHALSRQFTRATNGSSEVHSLTEGKNNWHKKITN